MRRAGVAHAGACVGRNCDRAQPGVCPRPTEWGRRRAFSAQPIVNRPERGLALHLRKLNGHMRQVAGQVCTLENHALNGSCMRACACAVWRRWRLRETIEGLGDRRAENPRLCVDLL
jgi:hypothetical protein